jgi:signal transduction histidine kinase/CheY-like chemotaxis protein
MSPEPEAQTSTGDRVLILAPVGRDARLAEHVLRRAGLAPRICADIAELRRELGRGAGALLLTAEALPGEDPDVWMGPEPTWSQIPLVVLTGPATSPPRIGPLRQLERRRNATFLERPVPRLTLVSALRAALEGRRKQYAARDMLEDLEAAVRQRDEFLAVLGHEIRNPLSVIANAVELLCQELPEASDTARFAGHLVERQTRNLGRILDDLLEVSRVTRGKLELRPQPVELGQSVRSLLDAARQQIAERGHHLEVVLPDRAVWVEADPTRVEQVLSNLLGNACKYTDPGGHITISLAVRGPDAEVRIVDDGRGMTAEFLARAFDLFAQAELGKGGLGLGLPLSRRLAELQQGSLDASSAGLGKGSAFVLRLPLREGCREPSSPSEPRSDPSSRRVLVVEDHADLAWGLELLLQRLGHEVRCARTGAEALSTAADYRPEVVLLDIGLPDMDGTDVARLLRAELGAEPFVAAMSGFGQESVRIRALQSGCDRHLTKPVALEELRELVASRR